MRISHLHLEDYRKKHPVLGAGEGLWGYFEVRTAGGKLRIISSGAATGNEEWEHVSVSLPNRTPTWAEMSLVKRLFWTDEETVVQFFPQKSAYVNDHKHCLHMWKHRDGHTLPPKELV